MSSLSSTTFTEKAMASMLDSDNIIRLATLLLGYFLGPYLGLITSDRNMLALGTFALFSPQITRGAIAGGKMVYNKTKIQSIPDVYNKLFITAVTGGGALYVLYAKDILTPTVVAGAIDGILNTNLSGDWAESATKMINYCSSLSGVTLVSGALTWIYEFVTNFVTDWIVGDKCEILVKAASASKTTPAPNWWDDIEKIKADQHPAFLFVTYCSILTNFKNVSEYTGKYMSAAFENAKETILGKMIELAKWKAGTESGEKAFAYYLNLEKEVYEMLDHARIWKDETISQVVKIIAAAKTWLQSAISYSYEMIESFVGTSNALPVCWCIGFIIAGIGATWITKRIYESSKTKTVKLSTKKMDKRCITEYGNTCYAINTASQQIFNVIVNDDDNLWDSLPIYLDRVLDMTSSITKVSVSETSYDCSKMLKPEGGEDGQPFTQQVATWFNVFKSVVSSKDKPKILTAFIELNQILSDLIVQTGLTIKKTGDPEFIDSVEHTSKKNMFELLEQRRLTIDMIKGEKINRKRPFLDQSFITLGRASESVDGAIGMFILS